MKQREGKEEERKGEMMVDGLMGTERVEMKIDGWMGKMDQMQRRRLGVRFWS